MLLIINLNTNVMLEPNKYIWNATKISILQQKFEHFCKIWVVDTGYHGFNRVFLSHSELNIQHCFLVFFFVRNLLTDSGTFCTWVKTCHIYFACTISLNKLCNDKASQTDIFTTKLVNSDNINILWVFWLLFILNQSCHQRHIAD